MAGPLLKTVKRLFAVSGNLCAFQGCRNQLVDKDQGTVLGEICHIKAESPGGKRYDQAQSDEERHGYDNLILMCRIHHTMIDDDEVAYTVERLHEMKHRHEVAYSGRLEIPDEMAQKLLLNAPTMTVGMQLNAATASNVQIGQVNLHQGVTVGDVRDIATDVFNSNFLRLRDEAALEVGRRFSAFRDQIVAAAQKQLSQAELDRFRDPDIQFKLYEVLQHGARTTDDDLRSRLAHLLIERVKADRQEPLRLLYNEAISTVPRLTRDQLNLLGLFYVGTHGVIPDRFRVKTWREFDERYGEMFAAFTKRRIPSWNRLHLQAAGCLVIGRSAKPFNLVRHVAGHHQVLFQRGIPAATVAELPAPDELKQRIFREKEDEPGKYVLQSHVHKKVAPSENAGEANAYRHTFEVEIPTGLLASLASLWQWAIEPLRREGEHVEGEPCESIYDIAAREPCLEELRKAWTESLFEEGQIELTFVGLTIAQTHVWQKTGRQFLINPKVL